MAFNYKDIQTCKDFEGIFINILDHHEKQEDLNSSECTIYYKTTKEGNYEKNSAWKNLFENTNIQMFKSTYEIKKKYVSRLYKKEKICFESFNPSIVSPEKKFRKTVKSIFV